MNCHSLKRLKVLTAKYQPCPWLLTIIMVLPVSFKLVYSGSSVVYCTLLSSSNGNIFIQQKECKCLFGKLNPNKCWEISGKVVHTNIYQKIILTKLAKEFWAYKKSLPWNVLGHLELKTPTYLSYVLELLFKLTDEFSHGFQGSFLLLITSFIEDKKAKPPTQHWEKMHFIHDTAWLYKVYVSRTTLGLDPQHNFRTWPLRCPG